jgi:hypothetical protein
MALGGFSANATRSLKGADMPKDRPVELILDLRRHCIETAIRRRYDQALGTYFKQEDARPRLEKDIELLLEALETLDFPALRGTHRPLAGKTEAHVTLSRDPQGQLSIHIDGQILPDLPRR